METFRVRQDVEKMEGIKRKFVEEQEVTEKIANKGVSRKGLTMRSTNHVECKRPKKCSINVTPHDEEKERGEEEIEEQEYQYKSEEGANSEFECVNSTKTRDFIAELKDDVTGCSQVNLRKEPNSNSLEVLKPKCVFPKNLEDDDEYRLDTFKYLMELELRYQRAWPIGDYFKKQTDITATERLILVDWLISVSDQYDITEQTVHLTVNFIDRFVSKMHVKMEKYQLLGATAMWVASKMEEVHHPDAEEFLYLCGNLYGIEQIERMERVLLNVLDFELQPPTVLTFINYLCTEYKLDEKTLHLSMYLSELVLLDGVMFFEYLPSKVAAACVVLARLTLSKRIPWPKQLKSFSGYNLQQLAPVVRKQHQVFKDTHRKDQEAVYKKYLSDKYHKVAALRAKDLTFAFVDA